MIAVDFARFVFAVLVIALVLLGGVWIGGEGARHWKERALRRCRLRCPLCGLDFYDESPRELVECPSCESTVARRGKGAGSAVSADPDQPETRQPVVVAAGDGVERAAGESRQPAATIRENAGL